MPAVAWIDTESTGLPADPRALLLEVGCQLTDRRLRFLGPGIERALAVTPDDAKARMVPHVQEMHTANGLLSTLHAAADLVDLAHAEQALLAHCEQHCPGEELWLGGRNTHHDRAFLTRFLPNVADRLHPYRVVDVCHQEWTARLTKPRRYRTCPRPQVAHRALADVHMAIEQHRHLTHRMPRLHQLWSRLSNRGAA